jgi:hypothetical protein
VSHGAAPALAGWTLTLAGIMSNAAFVVIICMHCRHPNTCGICGRD